MTERLKHLLDGEAHDLAVPSAPTDAVLRQGRGTRRRGRMTMAAGADAAALSRRQCLSAPGGGRRRASTRSGVRRRSAAMLSSPTATRCLPWVGALDGD